MSDDFSRVEAAFAAASPLATGEREDVLSGLSDRPDLRAEVKALLTAHDAIVSASPADDTVELGVQVGDAIGPYRLLEPIGRGGMGEVFKAERSDGAFDRHVAIKVMRSSNVDAELFRRFKVERQILASLRHPNIVTLLDGGTTPAGPAYLVMELVSGTEIMRHCRETSLSLPARLRLFRALCSAVQYAHQHGVVHRDLKPANILIEPDGTLKVLDFGVAKLLQGSPDHPDATRGVLPGPLTPNYASPEQLRGLPVTTASDVYSLGVILYELITGSRPYETQGLTLDRMLEIVVNTDPPPPSAGPERGHLRGDLDAIVMKAMSKDAVRRYDSAAELGSDVARYLERQPVVARAPSAAYVLRRLAGRNKTIVAVSALALIAVLTASGVAIWQREVARREQARADQRFREVRQLANALIFKIHDAVAPLAGSTPVRRTIVDQALAYLERLESESGADDPTLRLELAAGYRRIAAILGDPQKPNLGDREGAIAQYERARQIAIGLAGSGLDDALVAVIDADQSLATLYGLKEQPDRAIATAREAVEYATRYQARHPDERRAAAQLARANFSLAWSLPPAEAVPVWEQTLASYESTLQKEPGSVEAQRNVALVAKYLGGAFENLRKQDLAVAPYARAVELDEARLRAAPDDRQTRFDTAISVSGLGALAEHRGDLEEAERLFDRSLAIRRSVVAADPKDVQAHERLGYALYRSGKIRRARGRLDAGRAQIADGVALLERLLATTNDRSTRSILAEATVALGNIESLLKHREAACAAFRRADHHYRYLTPQRTAAHEEYAATAAREAAACR